MSLFGSNNIFLLKKRETRHPQPHLLPSREKEFIWWERTILFLTLNPTFSHQWRRSYEIKDEIDLTSFFGVPQ